MPPTRKNHDLIRRWKVALANASTTQAEWVSQYNWTEGHVGQVVADLRESPAVMEKVMAFIEEQERLIAERAPAAATNAA